MKKFIRQLSSPAFQLVRETAKKNWWLIAINLATSVISALLEGSTLGVIYLAVACLSNTSGLANEGAVDSAVLQKIYSILDLPSEGMFLVLIASALLLQICLSLSNYANKVAIAYFSAQAQPYVTSQVFERMMTFSYGCVSRYKVGDLLLFTSDAAIAVDRQIMEMNNIVINLAFSIVYLGVIVQLAPALAFAALAVSVVVASVQYKLIPRLRKVVKQLTTTQVESTKYITESIQGLRLLHTFGTQQNTVQEANQLLKNTQEQLQKRALLFYLPEPILDMVPMIALSILAASAILFRDSQASVLPMLLTFLLALQRLSTRLKSTAGTITRFADNSARMMRLESILDRRDKVFEETSDQPFARLNTSIDFKSVSLSYDEKGEELALSDLTFSIPRNRITALVGESGAGKSSIVDLLMGLYQPTSGDIVVNGRSLTDYRLSEWRQHIGVVSQDTFIFNKSIVDNLRYGRPEATLQDVVDSAKAAQAHDFILALPDGYETIVGERGYRLSGGQRQRLALARALIKQPEILILDEATSALDSQSEMLIQEALNLLQKEKTVIVIAHRLSTIAEADQILVLDKGKIAEQGTHKSLVGLGARYAQYWKLQSGVRVA